MKRIIWHWPGGTYKPNATERRRYHFLIDGDGTVHRGDFPPEANEVVVPNNYAAHTLHCNTGSIGVTMCGMRDAIERPFQTGKYPIKIVQVERLAELSAVLGIKYLIPVTRQTMLSHAEVQPTLGIKQRRKWDITWLPGMMEPEDAVAVGDMLRAKVQGYLADENAIRQLHEERGWIW